MSWLQAPYRTKMRLVRDDPTEYEVVWRYCKPGALFLPFPTVFDSTAWDYDHRPPAGYLLDGLGEVSHGHCPSKVHRYPAEPGLRGPDGTGQPNGTADWWVNGVPSRSLFAWPDPTTVCGIPFWESRGVAVGSDPCSDNFGQPDHFGGGMVAMGGIGHFQSMMGFGDAEVAMGGVGGFSSAVPYGDAEVAMGGDGVFSFAPVLESDAEAAMGGDGDFELD